MERNGEERSSNYYGVAEGVVDGKLVGIKVAEAEAVGVALADVTGAGLSVEIGIKVGQAANSQFGPVLPTLLPSGQIIASIVQAIGVVPDPKYFGIKKYAPAEATAIIIKITAIIKTAEDFLTGGGGVSTTKSFGTLAVDSEGILAGVGVGVFS